MNASLKEEFMNLQVDLLSETTDSTDSDADDSAIEPTLQSIIGNLRKYTPEIRKLYYNLLAEQVPVSKISDIIRHVLIRLKVLKTYNYQRDHVQAT